MLEMENAYALVIGIAEYLHINKIPPTIIKDAQDIFDLLIDSQHCGYPPKNVQLLLNGQATKKAIHQAFNDLTKHSNQDSSVFFYLSCHGGRIETDPCVGEYLLSVDAVHDSDQTIAQTAISDTEFTYALRTILARKVVVVFDCCHAGGIGQPQDATGPMLKAGLSEHYYEVLQADRGRVILASSRSIEYSYIQPGANNSLFTQYLLDSLRGAVPGRRGGGELSRCTLPGRQRSFTNFSTN